MAASFSGKQFFPLLLLLLVSLFSSAHVIRGSTRQFFSKFVRDNERSQTTTTKNTDPTKKEQRPYFKLDSEKAHGLSDNNPRPPTPPNKKPANAPQTTPSWLPSNYNNKSYVTNSNEVSPYIIEEDKEDHTTSTTKYNPELEPTEFEESAEQQTYNSKYEDEELEEDETQTYDKSIKYTNNAQENVRGSHGKRKTNFHPTRGDQQQHGMSDTRTLENGKYYFDVRTNSFTSESHPYNLVTNRNTDTDTNNYHKYNDPMMKSNNKQNNYGQQSYAEDEEP